MGPNEAARQRRSPLAQIVPLLGNPLAIVLLVAAGLSALLGEKLDAGLIAGMVVVSVGMNLFQTGCSQRAAERLRDRVAHTAAVMRDGYFLFLVAATVVYLGIVEVTKAALMKRGAFRSAPPTQEGGTGSALSVLRPGT